MHRFPNGAVRAADGSLRWDVLGSTARCSTGLRGGRAPGRLHGIGIDSWAVDYGLLDARRRAARQPVLTTATRAPTASPSGCVADGRRRTSSTPSPACSSCRSTPLFQLVAARDAARSRRPRTLLLLPDLLGYWLTGEVGAERTNASTTGLSTSARGTGRATWPSAVGLPRSTCCRRCASPARLGRDAPARGGASDRPAPACPWSRSGRTTRPPRSSASPPATSRSAYISSGTWSLVGLELDAPGAHRGRRGPPTSPTRAASTAPSASCERDGLWVLSECVREPGARPDLAAAAGRRPRRRQPLRAGRRHRRPAAAAAGRHAEAGSRRWRARRASRCRRSPRRGHPLRPRQPRAGLPPRASGRAAALAGRDVEVVHVVGGGARNELLCQLTADACGLPVLAGPAEAAALGQRARAGPRPRRRPARPRRDARAGAAYPRPRGRYEPGDLAASRDWADRGARRATVRRRARPARWERMRVAVMVDLHRRRDVPGCRARDGAPAAPAGRRRWRFRRRRPAAGSRWSTPATSTRPCRWCGTSCRRSRGTTTS